MEMRLEQNCDWDSIREVTESALKGKPFADGDEQDLIDKLREKGA